MRPVPARLAVLGAALALTVPLAIAQSGLTDSQRHAALRELVALLSLPNVASNQADIRKNAEYLRAAFERRGFASAIVTTPRSPVVMAERPPDQPAPADGGRTITFYFHYDGQPVSPAEWRDSGPFEPIFRDGPVEAGSKLVRLSMGGPIGRDWRIYARSSADDKGEIVALLSALDAVMASRQRLRDAGDPHHEVRRLGTSGVRLRASALRHQVGSWLWPLGFGPIRGWALLAGREMGERTSA